MVHFAPGTEVVLTGARELYIVWSFEVWLCGCSVVDAMLIEVLFILAFVSLVVEAIGILA